jgi:hypothetical protein
VRAVKAVKYRCPLAPSDECQYGGAKRYNYGFVSGVRPFCSNSRQWITNMLTGKRITCPIASNQTSKNQHSQAAEGSGR